MKQKFKQDNNLVTMFWQRGANQVHKIITKYREW